MGTTYGQLEAVSINICTQLSHLPAYVPAFPDGSVPYTAPAPAGPPMSARIMECLAEDRGERGCAQFATISGPASSGLCPGRRPRITSDRWLPRSGCSLPHQSPRIHCFAPPRNGTCGGSSGNWRRRTSLDAQQTSPLPLRRLRLQWQHLPLLPVQPFPPLTLHPLPSPTHCAPRADTRRRTSSGATSRLRTAQQRTVGGRTTTTPTQSPPPAICNATTNTAGHSFCNGCAKLQM